MQIILLIHYFAYQIIPKKVLNCSTAHELT